MRNWKWRVAAILALLPTVFGQLSPVYAADSAPTATTYPVVVVSDELVAGNTVSATAADWDATPTPTLTSQWYSCATQVLAEGDTLPTGCVAIAGATSTSLALTNALKAKFLVFGSFAANSVSGATPLARYSASTVGSVMPAPALKPTVLGSNSTVKFTQSSTPAQNSKYTVDVAGWVTASAFTYKWYRCDEAIKAGTSAPTGCEEIGGATAASYVVSSLDVDKYVTSLVTAKNGASTVATTRIASATSVSQVPVNVAPAALFAGVVAVGRTLTAIDGTWMASPSATFTYQWYSCSAAVPAAAVKNSKCAVIAGATSANYVIAAGMNNKYLVVQVKATNSTNATSPVSSFSASTSKVLTSPSNTVAPRLVASQSATTGQPVAGSSVSVVAGTWTGNPAPTKTYRWFLCDTAISAAQSTVPDNCAEINGANGTSVTTTVEMQGKFLAVEETATNLAQAVTLVSASTLGVQSKPIFSGDPTLAGNADSAGSLTLTSGASNFGGTPNESYAWAKCATAQAPSGQIPTGCTVLAGQTDATLQLDTSLEGYFIVGRVTLTNVAGQTVRTSATSSQVTGNLVNVQLGRPTSTKNFAQLGFALEANNGNWTGFPAPTFEYNWYRCAQPVAAKADGLTDGCVEISGATERTYIPVTADAAKYLMVKVTGVQGSTRVSVYSPTSYQILEAPSFTGSPSVGNQHVIGGPNLVAVIGAIRGTSEPAIDFAWYRCSAPVAADSPALAVGCALIAGANDGSYPLVTADVGKYVLASITMTNELGTVKRYTSSSQLVNVAPANLTIAAPVSSSTPSKVGFSISAGAHTWTGNPTAQFTYQWFRCDSQQRSRSLDVPYGCTAISGQTQSSITPTTTEAGKYLLIAVRGYNEHGSQTVYSPSTLDVAEPPRFIRGPILNTLRNKGEDLEVTVSERAGWPAPAVSYRWFRCTTLVDSISTTLPAGCTVIQGASSDIYTLTLADVAKYIVAEQKLKNSVGEIIKYSASSLEILQAPEIAATVRITGNQWTGQTLTATGVSVAGYPAPVTTLQWIRCPSGVIILANCSLLATGVTTYQLRTADRGNQIYVKVSARNSAGTDEYLSPGTSEINMPPKLVALTPSVLVDPSDRNDNEARAATTVSAIEGVWDASPAVDSITGYKYQWYLCSLPHPVSSATVPLDCAAIKNAVTADYLVKATEKEKFLGFSLKVSNGTEDVNLFSATTARVYVVPLYMSGAKPSFAVNQAASDGSPRIGYEVEASVGTWQGSPIPNYTYQWFSCSRQMTVTSETLDDLCQDIVGATGRTYSITSNQLGKFLGVRINGAYKSYSDEVYSVTTAKSVVAPPVNTVAPRITTRYTYVQSTLKTTDGTWVGTPAPTQSHTWWECDQPVPVATSVQPENCRELANSTGNWLVPASQNGKYISSLVVSTNTAGSAKLWSASTEQIVTGSVNLVAPTVSVVAPSVPFTGSNFASTLVDLKISDTNPGDWAGTPLPEATANEYSWYRCVAAVATSSDVLNSGCQLIETNASTATYRPVAADVGQYLVGAVKNDNGVGASIVYTPSSEAILQPPNNTLAPNISGKAFVDQIVTGDKGTWDGLPVPTFATQWLACDAVVLAATQTAPANCAVIDRATELTFKPTDDLLGKFLVFRVTATNKVGEQIVWSASTAAVVSGPVKKADPTFTYPATTTTPVTRLNPIVGQVLTTDGGVWRGVPTPSKSYEWLLCPTALTSSATAPATEKLCELVPGENAREITPTETMRGKFLMVHVHASNENGDADFYSATTTAVWMAPIVDHVVEVFGTTFHRLTVKAKFDTWKAFPEVTKTYEWFVCTSAIPNSAVTLPNGCTAISGATTSKYKIPDASIFPHTNEYLVVKIRVSNAVNSSEHYSATSSQIVVGPVNERAPTVTGTAHFTAGTVTNIVGTAGTWSPADSNLSYQWYRCESVLATDDELDPKCVLLPGANSLTYQLTDQDPGKSLMMAVTGEKNFLNSTVYSASTALVTEKARNVVPPSVTGVPKVNETSTGVDGDWRGFPAVTKLRTWYACSERPLLASSTINATKCKLLSGAVTDSVINDLDLVGKYLVYAVTASNKVGTVTTKVTMYSAGTEAVADPPVVAEKPTLVRPTNAGADDGPAVGSVWGSKIGWTNKVPPAQTYQWYRCATAVDSAATAITVLPDGCEAISAATDATYTIRIDDRNMYIMVGITGTNAAGTATQFSNSTFAPVAQAPVADPLPSMSGNHVAGSTLTIDLGVWTPSNAVITYNWYSCTTAVPTTTSEQPPSTCTNMSRAGLTYVLGTFDEGKYITAQVIGTAQSGSPVTSYFLGVTEPVTKAPVNTTMPNVSGDSYLVGMLLTAKDDKWSAAPDPVKTYQWYTCTSVVALAARTLDGSCSEITGATQSTYQIDRSYTGKYVLVSITATNSAGAATVYSASTSLAVVAGYEPVTDVTVAATDGVTQITSNGTVELTQTTGTWSHGVDTTQPLTQHRWIACTAPITSALSRWQGYCFPIFNYVDSSRKLDTAETRPLTLDLAYEYAGYYVSVVEYVLKPGSNPAYDVSTNRQALRVAKTSAKITIAPTLWDDSPSYFAPRVTQGSMVGHVSSVTQINDWQPDTDYLSDNALAQVTWRGVEAGTFSYQWFSCVTKQSTLSKVALPSGCENISGATSATFTPTTNEVREYIGARITATNDAGSATVWTKTSEKVTQAPTVVVGSEPVLTVGQFTQEVASVTTGTWQAEPAPTFTYKWMMCAASVNPVITDSVTPQGCTVLSGSSITSQSTQIVVPSLLGKNQSKKLAVQVIATNTPYFAQPTQTKAGYASVASGELKEKPYYNLNTPVALTSSPTTSVFAANVGETITMTNDQNLWYVTPVESSGLTFTYAWYTCALTNLTLQRTETPLSDCVVVQGETGKSLELTDRFAGLKVMGQVTAYSSLLGSNGYGYATTATTAPVAQKPILSRAPSVSVSNGGQPMVGVKLVGDNGEWSSYPTPTIDTNNYWWFACDTAVTAGNTQKSGCVQLSPPTSTSSYTPSSADAGKYIVFAPLARSMMNPVNTGRYEYDREYSAGLGPILMAPAITFASPAYTGTAHVGQTLVTSMPTVRAYPSATSTSFEWYSCATPSVNDSVAAVPSTCNKVGDTNQTSITVDDTMVGRYLEIYAISTNSVKSVRKNTVATQSVTRSPTNVNPPTLSGTPLANGTNKIVPTAGTWRATPSVNSYTYLWYLCTSISSTTVATKPASCTAYGSSTSTPVQLTLTREMAGKFLVLEESATQPSNNMDSGKTGRIFSVSTNEILSQPQFDVEPSIAGYRHVGEDLTVNVGTVSGNPTPSTSVQWLSCSSPVTSKTSITGNGCTSISNATAATFTATPSEADRYLTAQVVASNGVAATTFYVPSTAQKVTQSPGNVTPVSIRGDSQVGSNKTLTVTDGTWTGAPTPTKTYNWYYCDTAKTAAATVNSDCVLATGTNGVALNAKTITLTSEYRGKHIVAVEIASATSNKPDAGTAQSVSASMGPINMAPVLASAPTISGVFHVGQTLTATLPAVTAYPLNNSTYDWWSCNSALASSVATPPTGCTVLSGLGNAALVITEELAGKFIAVAVSNSNDFGAVTKSSTGLFDVTRSPQNTGDAAISGDAKVGASVPLTVSTGTWTSSPIATASDFSYAWYQCAQEHSTVPSTLPADCSVISQQTASSLSPTNAMAGKFLLAKVTLNLRSNLAGAGVASVFTASSASVRNLPQLGGAAPTISGTAHLGETLTANLASVTGNDAPTSSYGWWQCTDVVSAGASDITANCSAIADSNDAALVITSNLVGKRIAVLQTATNTVGSSTAASATTLVVSSSPTNTVSPTISGTDVYTSTATVTAAAGTWTGSPTPVAANYAYLWYQCTNPAAVGSALPSGCTSTALSAASIPLNKDWVDKYLVLKVTATTATNKSGTGSAVSYSASFGPIRIAPTNTVAPTFSPTSLAVGRTVTANVGTWTGTNPKTYTYKWFSCASTATLTSTSTCTAIAGFDNQNLVVPSTMSGKKLLLTVTATNSAGSAVKSYISGSTVAAASLSPLALRAIL